MGDKPVVIVNPSRKLVHQMTFSFYDDKSVSEKNVPASLQEAKFRMDAAWEVILRLFIDKAKSGELDDNNTIIQSQIIPFNG